MTMEMYSLNFYSFPTEKIIRNSFFKPIKDAVHIQEGIL